MKFRFAALLILFLPLASVSAWSQDKPTKEELLASLNALPELHVDRLPILQKLVKYCWRPCAAEAMEYALEGLSILERTPTPEFESSLHGHIAVLYLRQINYEKAQFHIDQGIPVARSLGKEEDLALLLFSQASLYYRTNKDILAENIYLQLLETYKALENLKGIAVTYNNLGSIAEKLNNYGQALEYYLAGVENMQTPELLFDRANTLINAGGVYNKLGDYDLAIETINKGLSLIESESAPGIYINGLIRLKEVYHNLGEYGLAIENRVASFELAKASNFREPTQAAEADIAELYLLKGDLIRANEYMQRAKTGLNSATPDVFRERIQFAEAKVILANGDIETANSILEKITQSVKEGDASLRKLEYLQSLIDVKKQSGQWQQSTALSELYNQRYRELTQNNRDSRVAQYKALFQATEQEKRITALERETATQSLEVLQAQKNSNQVIFISTLVSLVLFGVIYFGMQKRKVLRFEADLMRANAERKRRLFADISHELRTPLAVLKLQLEGLEYQLVDDPSETYQLLHEKIASINALISDVSQLSQADAGNLAMDFKVIKIKAFFEHWQKDMLYLAEQRGLVLRSKIELNDEDTVELDAQRMTQVLGNLLSNSCRYTDAPGEIHVKVRIKQRHLECRIEDTAPGLSEEQLEQVFERLYRADKSRSRESGGSGLGLTICQSLVTTHKGTIVASSSPLGGVRMDVKIPVEQ